MTNDAQAPLTAGTLYEVAARDYEIAAACLSPLTVKPEIGQRVADAIAGALARAREAGAAAEREACARWFAGRVEQPWMPDAIAAAIRARGKQP